MNDILYHPASFKDPSGFMFQADGIFYRQVNKSYAANYDLLMQSGLYEALSEKKMLIPHSVIEKNFTGSADWYKTLQPDHISFISYPYEWCFDQLKDAALLTLEINLTAIKHGMILKDASAFNIQFHKGRPIFIDSLSFDEYQASKPWIAYRQFCGHFLFPLLIGHYLPMNAQQLLSIYIDGLPADLTASVLPFKTKLKLGTVLHVHLQNSISNKKNNQPSVVFDQKKMERLLSHLEEIIRPLQKKPVASGWDNYYDETILSKNYLAEKEKIIRNMIASISAHTALDIGSNNGFFSKLLAEKNINVIAMDADHHCINELYKQTSSLNQSDILPLVIDISNPTPAIGWDNKERSSFLSRADADLVLALAIVHHLAVTQHISFRNQAAGFCRLTKKYLLIEYVPIEDEKARELAQRNPNHHAYSENEFETSFSIYFKQLNKQPVPESSRVIYLYEKNGSYANA